MLPVGGGVFLRLFSSVASAALGTEGAQLTRRGVLQGVDMQPAEANRLQEAVIEGRYDEAVQLLPLLIQGPHPLKQVWAFLLCFPSIRDARLWVSAYTLVPSLLAML